MTEIPTESTSTITELSKPARRVLGVLVEKAFTTPEYYPLTLKAVTAGCNQKSNRSPIVTYSEDDVYDTLESLREMGLTAVVHTESGRTERFRHYMRKCFTFSEPQLAILTELLLRGRQQLGELRSRAGRMVTIDSLDQLRMELEGLIQMGFVQSGGPLERRGAEVDHNLYTEKEGKPFFGSSPENRVSEPTATDGRPDRPARQSTAASAVSAETIERIHSLEATIAVLQQDDTVLRSDLDATRSELKQLAARFEELRSELGG